MSIRHRLQKTKIIATIGPACDDESVLRDMISEGVNVARLNLSHGDFEQHAERITRVRRAADAVGVNLAIMIDTRGREIRTGKLEGGSVTNTHRGLELARLRRQSIRPQAHK